MQYAVIPKIKQGTNSNANRMLYNVAVCVFQATF